MENIITCSNSDLCWYINDQKISDSIFQEDKHEFRIDDREEFIDELINWISQANNPLLDTGPNTNSRLILMKEDLKYLINLEDEFIFNSSYTNKYIAESDNKVEFNKICEELKLLSL